MANSKDYASQHFAKVEKSGADWAREYFNDTQLANLGALSTTQRESVLTDDISDIENRMYAAMLGVSHDRLTDVQAQEFQKLIDKTVGQGAEFSLDRESFLRGAVYFDKPT